MLILPTGIFSQPKEGLVARYTFNNGDYKDEAGPNHAKASGTSLDKDRFGNPNSACFLNGNHGSYLNLGTSRTLKPIHGTISLWAKVDYLKESGTGVEVTPFILTKNAQRDDFYEGYWIGYSWRSKKASANTTLDETNQVSIYGSDTIDIFSWHHFVITYDDDFLCLYVDGKLENKMPKNFRSIFSQTDSVVVGNTANKKNSRFLLGRVDDIMIYDRVLRHEEVKELYAAPDPNRNAIYYTWLKRGLVIAGILSLIGFLIRYQYKKALQKERDKNKIAAKLNEFETKALRAQMNPHFLFNSLATLDLLILEENTNAAHSYLTRFSKLLRKLLESSLSDTISVADEIVILEQYVRLEMMRFESGIDFQIINQITEPEKVHIPLMLVQPFVENAIWHGLSQKKENRQLFISFMQDEKKTIRCVVSDNGVGMSSRPKQINPLKKKSLAIEFISQRLELLSKTTGIKCSVKIESEGGQMENQSGTSVEIIIPVMNQL